MNSCFITSRLGLENSTHTLVFMSASGCRANENFDISSENYVMQGKCLFKEISRPENPSVLV